MKAFPASSKYNDKWNGMDLRDYFASKALQGYLSHVPYDKVIDPSRAAGVAYLFANAMMKERERKDEQV
jgi:hypothetical protein